MIEMRINDQSIVESVKEASSSQKDLSRDAYTLERPMSQLTNRGTTLAPIEKKSSKRLTISA